MARGGRRALELVEAQIPQNEALMMLPLFLCHPRPPGARPRPPPRARMLCGLGPRAGMKNGGGGRVGAGEGW